MVKAMMEKIKENKDAAEKKQGYHISNPLFTMAVFALLISTIVMGFYLNKYHPGYLLVQEDWRAFGDYIGGVFDSLFGYLGGLALLIILLQQQKQLVQNRQALTQSQRALQQNKTELELTVKELVNSARALEVAKDISVLHLKNMHLQVKKEDIYRMIKNVYEDIAQFKNCGLKVKAYKKNILKKEDQYPFMDVFSFPSCKLYVVLDENVKTDSRRKFEAANELSLLLLELKKHLESFQRLVDDDHVNNYYKSRVVHWAKGLHHHQLISEHVVAFFDENFPGLQLEIAGKRQDVERYLEHLINFEWIRSSTFSGSGKDGFFAKLLCKEDDFPVIAGIAKKCNIMIVGSHMVPPSIEKG